jgi:hypothetical protein
MKSIFIVLVSLFFFLHTEAYAVTITAVASGNWSSNSTWSCNCQPTNSDNIVIPAGITVTSTGPVILFLGPVITITVSGTLILNNGSLQVDASDIISIPTGGKISGTGITGGAVYSGAIPIFIANGSSINGPQTITGGSLPITLLFFKGETQDKEVLLEWASATEINFDYYAIQRCGDGIHFKTIGKVQGAGNSTTQLNYSYTDSDPLQSVGYYRLQAINMDGTVADNAVITVNFETTRTVEIFPNPVTGGTLNARLNFYPEEGGQIAVWDSNGSIILQKALTSTECAYTFELIPNMGKGLYFVVVSTTGEKLKTKIIVN